MLLSQTEKEWLLGNVKLSEGYERKIKSAIKKKIQNFQKFELPFLIKNELLSYPHVTESCNNVMKYSNGNNSCFRSNYSIIDNFPVESTKIFQNDNQKWGNFNGPNAIRTRDPRHVKAVS